MKTLSLPDRTMAAVTGMPTVLDLVRHDHVPLTVVQRSSLIVDQGNAVFVVVYD